MARFKDRKVSAVCVIEFKELVQQQTFGKLSVELIKYILYQREQIPLPFVQLKRWLTDESEKERKQSELIRNKKMRKAKRFLESCEEVFDSVLLTVGEKQSDFKLQQVLVCLGGTPVSPKEVYIIRLPRQPTCKHCIHSAPKSFRSCMTRLFREMISTDGLLSSSKLSPTQCTIMLQVLRKNPLPKNMEPKLYFKVPVRGKHVILDFCFSNCCHVEMDQFPVFSDSDMDLGESVNNDINIIAVGDLESTNNSNMDKSLVCLVEDLTLKIPSEDDYIWVQLKPTIKGFKDSCTKQASELNIWM
ncbi:MAD2L1-binding protein-like isoform X2 [Limulus polyphemus]|uniref:MAD2L1-binding protein-like isoform X2 n=1 Tax=Limulus polyphemus TaxID=6850 RepID=A0ABM1S944_LIMPO|nr:MAD2L1-binding protein-like isoform X2 [Limulus polyphemus]